MIFLAANLCAQEGGSVDIDRYGKRIQLDGYLIEWNNRTAHVWDNSGVWYWDAINTPEGIAGYIRSEHAVPCTSWTFVIEPSGNSEPLLINVSPGAPPQEHYSIDRDLLTSSSAISLEWIIPWDQADLDVHNQYAIDLRGRSACNEILPPLILSGSKDPPKRIITPKIIVQAVFIALLLTFYIIMRIRIRNQTLRRRSPHREA
jgi:hypothetical protein